MLDGVLSVIVDLLAYQLGRGLLLLLTWGRYDATKRNANIWLVGGFGVMVFLVVVVGVAGWINNGWS